MKKLAESWWHRLEWLLPYLRAILSPALLSGAAVVGFLYLFPIEFLKTILSSPLVWGTVAIVFLLLFKEETRRLIDRVIKITLPGGGELSTSQREREPKESESLPRVPASDEAMAPAVSPGLTLTQEQVTTISQNFAAQRAITYLWEYRYLNLFLVRGTQEVLDWLLSCAQPPSVELYFSWWLPSVPDPKEREARLRVLEVHVLVQIEDHLIKVTDKGREYQKWRGQLPPRTQ